MSTSTKYSGPNPASHIEQWVYFLSLPKSQLNHVIKKGF